MTGERYSKGKCRNVPSLPPRHKDAQRAGCLNLRSVLCGSLRTSAFTAVSTQRSRRYAENRREKTESKTLLKKHRNWLGLCFVHLCGFIPIELYAPAIQTNKRMKRDDSSRGVARGIRDLCGCGVVAFE